jgi:hypothetical protein
MELIENILKYMRNFTGVKHDCQKNKEERSAVKGLNNFKDD